MELFRILGTIAIDNDAANTAIDETANRAENADTRTTGAFSRIAKTAVKVGKAVVGAGTVMAGAFVAAVEGTREYRVSMGMLETAFAQQHLSAGAAKQTYSELNAVLGDSQQATEAAQQLAQLADNEKELNNWTNILTGVYATFGEALPVEGLAEAANETAKTGVLTGGLTDALNWAGVAEDDFQASLDACTTEQERQKLITETLNGLYGEAAEKYKEVNADVIAAEQAQGRLTDAMARLGEIGEPILTAVKTAVADMADVAIPKIEELINKFKDGVTWIQENQNAIQTWIGVILGAVTAISIFVLIISWSAIMTAATNAVKKVRLAIIAFNAVLAANPIGLVVAAIAGLVAAFIYLWNNVEPFREFWINLWERIKTSASNAIKYVNVRFDSLKSALNTVRTTFGNIQKAISDRLQAAQDKVKSVVDKIRGFFPLRIGKIFSNLQIPKISVNGGKAPFGIAGKGKLPSFNVRWNAEGGILTQPTIFGMNPRTGTMLGGGESGDEAIAPIDTLQAYINESVNSRNMELIAAIEIQISRLILFLQENMPADYQIRLDSGALVGELAPAMDGKLADIYRHNKRGNTR